MNKHLANNAQIECEIAGSTGQSVPGPDLGGLGRPELTLARISFAAHDRQPLAVEFGYANPLGSNIQESIAIYQEGENLSVRGLHRNGDLVCFFLADEQPLDEILDIEGDVEASMKEHGLTMTENLMKVDITKLHLLASPKIDVETARHYGLIADYVG